MKINANGWFERWGVWPMAGGVDPPPVEPPPVEPPPAEPPAAAPPVVGMETKLDGDQIPEELRGKSLSEVIDLLQQPAQPLPPAQPPAEPPAGGPDQMEELRASYYRDPVGTTTELIRMALAPVMDNLYQVQSEKGRAVIAANPDYELLRKDVDEFMTHVPPNLKADPKAWDIAYNYARGKNFDKLAKREPAAPPPNLPPPTGGGGGLVPIEITAEEEAVAAKFGMTKKDWAEAKKL